MCCFIAPSVFLCGTAGRRTKTEGCSATWVLSQFNHERLKPDRRLDTSRSTCCQFLVWAEEESVCSVLWRDLTASQLMIKVHSELWVFFSSANNRLSDPIRTSHFDLPDVSHLISMNSNPSVAQNNLVPCGKCSGDDRHQLVMSRLKLAQYFYSPRGQALRYMIRKPPCETSVKLFYTTITGLWMRHVTHRRAACYI